MRQAPYHAHVSVCCSYTVHVPALCMCPCDMTLSRSPCLWCRRQKALLASFAAQQKLFADTMLSDSEEEGEEQDEEQAEEKVECVICSQSAFPSEDSPVGLVCLVQRSSILADHSHKARAAFCAWRGLGGLGGEMRIAENLDSCGNLHFQSCGHHIHVSCFNSYTETLNQNQSMRDQQRFDQASGLFLCPLCRQMGNALMPLLPKGAAREAGERSRHVLDSSPCIIALRCVGITLHVAPFHCISMCALRDSLGSKLHSVL
jgi:hypothetical protein